MLVLTIGRNGPGVDAAAHNGAIGTPMPVEEAILNRINAWGQVVEDRAGKAIDQKWFEEGESILLALTQQHGRLNSVHLAEEVRKTMEDYSE